jgi:hypothetical protein
MTACHLAIMDQAHQLHLGLGDSGGGYGTKACVIARVP